MISVTIPVGPHPGNARYLRECLASVAEQTLQPADVVVIDDMAAVATMLEVQKQASELGLNLKIWRAPWRLGVAAAFNFGVALAESELVFMLGSDDRLLPKCLAECLDCYDSNARRDLYYNVGVKFSDGREDQYIACNAAAVTKGLWRQTGGFPLESSVGAPDAALLSIMLGTRAGYSHVVNGREPLYWYRVHGETDTAGRGAWQGVILEVRNLVTATWQRPQWGRRSGGDGWP